MADGSRQARADARRARAVLHKARLDSAEHDLSPLFGAEAVSLVLALTRESYSLGGLAEPSYARSRIPCQFVPGRLT